MHYPILSHLCIRAKSSPAALEPSACYRRQDPTAQTTPAVNLPLNGLPVCPSTTKRESDGHDSEVLVCVDRHNSLVGVPEQPVAVSMGCSSTATIVAAAALSPD